MKKLLLIGDSIRAGYDVQVRDALAGQAEVFFPKENCRFAEYVLRSLFDWKSGLGLETVDVVHWNAGLWDTLYVYGKEEGPLTPIEVYDQFIRRIFRAIAHEFPGARQIFAASTPVQEALYTGQWKRYNADIRRYNEVARAAAADYGAEYNDLYAVVAAAPTSYYSDMTHLYTPEGTEMMTNAVLRAVCPTLGLETPEHVRTVSGDVEVVGI